MVVGVLEIANMQPKLRCTDRLEPYFSNRQKVLKSCRTLIHAGLMTEKIKPFDVIVVRGVSGLLYGPPLADLLDKKLAVVRKPHDTSNERVEVEGWRGPSFLIVDDVRATGATEHEIRTAYGQAVYDSIGAFPHYRGCLLAQEGVLLDHEGRTAEMSKVFLTWPIFA
jgi:adenine/guanine phosphoribosyltransferase-like PRPP-binding protein